MLKKRGIVRTARIGQGGTGARAGGGGGARERNGNTCRAPLWRLHWWRVGGSLGKEPACARSITSKSPHLQEITACIDMSFTNPSFAAGDLTPPGLRPPLPPMGVPWLRKAGDLGPRSGPLTTQSCQAHP